MWARKPFVLSVFFICWAGCLAANPWKAGTAVTSITPDSGLWMAGYAARTHPSEGTLQELKAKALALEDLNGERALLISMDLLGFSSDFVESIVTRIQTRHGISRSRILFNASHTHSGPALSGNLEVAYRMTEEQRADVQAYTRALEHKVVNLVDQAIAVLAPAQLHSGRTRVNFAVNRRVRTPQGFIIGVNRSGPVDHGVPFLVVDNERGQLQTIVFGYSCHNTTVGGDQYQFHGDYAGWAQQWLEAHYPGSVAMFVTGTAGDANPYPRGTVSLAKQHGEALAHSVSDSLTGPLTPLSGPLRASFEHVSIEFSRLPTREELERRLQEEDIFRKRHAQLLLRTLDQEGRIDPEYPYPVQIWQFGGGLTLVALAGEVVVDYGLRLRKELSSQDLWVLGYSNDVFAYIPSRRILSEGGYEAEDAMIYYGQPGPFAPNVEDLIVDKVREMARRLTGSP